MTPQRRLLSAAGLAVSLYLAASAGSAAFVGEDGPLAVIKDIRIGERDGQTRIALFCRRACAPEALGGGVFIIDGAGDEFSLDVSEANARVSRIDAEQKNGAALITVDFAGDLKKSLARPCTVGGEGAACLDLFFETAPSQAALIDKNPAPAPRPAPSVAEPRKPAPEEPATTTKPAEMTVLAEPAPALRDGPTDRKIALVADASGERLSPPTSPILAKVQPIESAIVVATPTLRQTAPVQPVRRDFAGRINVLLGKSLSPAYCNNAEATLQADPWALGAMVDVGLCAGARGDAEEAESILSRLLEYTPDNYEALVGRAIIAERAGEKGAALRYYQEALDALPPVKESARIVEAMAAIG
ncbi:MAG: hypothetical protein AAFW81_07900 [Pseudomonadota bacterium]